MPSDSQLNILVIASTYPRHEDDYAVPWMRASHEHLTNRGHQVTVLAPSYMGLGDHQVDDVSVKRFRYAPIQWERLTHEQGAPNKIKSRRMQLLAIPYVIFGCIAAMRLARKHRYDAIHVHWPFPHQPMGWIAARICKAPLITMSHGAGFALARRKKWVGALLRKCLLVSDYLVANSRDTAQKIRQLCGRSAHIIPYGSTVESLTVDAIANDRPRVLFTGRLIERKGVEYLLKATPEILQHCDADIVISGNGDQMDMLKQTAADLDIEHRVSFLGFISNEQLAEEYARCDVWVNPSVIDSRGDTEGLGVGSIEAYAHRKPVIASAVGGIPDTVVDGQTGYLVPEKRPDVLAEKIVHLLNSPEKARAFGNAGWDFACQEFSWDSITDRLETLFSAAVSRGKVLQSIMKATHARQPLRKRSGPFVLLGRLAVVALVTGAIVTATAQLYDRIPSLPQINSLWLMTALMATLVYRVANAHGWTFALKSLHQKLPSAKALQIWLTSEACRWLPGSLWSYGSRGYQASKHGISSMAAGASLMVELSLTIAAWSTLAVFGLVWYRDEFSQSFHELITAGEWSMRTRIGLVIVLATAGCLAIRKLLGSEKWKNAKVRFRNLIGSSAQPNDDAEQGTSVSRSPICYRTVALTYGYYITMCLLNGLAATCVVRALPDADVPVAAVLCANAAAWLIGFFAIFAPGGLWFGKARWPPACCHGCLWNKR